MSDNGEPTIGRAEPVAGLDGRSGEWSLSDISRAIVKLYKEQFGRGPEHAYTRYCGPDTIVTLISNSLTPAERRMLALGEHQRLRETRLMFQYASENEFRTIIETITGRHVLAFMSGMDVNADLSCEVFSLAPSNDPD